LQTDDVGILWLQDSRRRCLAWSRTADKRGGDLRTALPEDTIFSQNITRERRWRAIFGDPTSSGPRGCGARTNVFIPA